MILTGAFVLALNCGNVFASEAGMTGESNTEATIVEENGAADNVQNPADSQVVNDQNGNSYSVNSADVPESGDPAVEPTEPPADPPAEMKQGWQDEDIILTIIMLLESRISTAVGTISMKME